MSSARDFRRWCQELTIAVKAGHEGTRDRQKLINELKVTCDTWRRDLDEGYKYRTRTITFGLSSSVLSVQVSKLKDPILWKGKEGLVFLNDLLRSRHRSVALKNITKKITNNLQKTKSLSTTIDNLNKILRI